ncbi:MAG: hypothetical protein ACOC2Y_00240 [Spirochaetota bacterium]
MRRRLATLAVAATVAAGCSGPLGEPVSEPGSADAVVPPSVAWELVPGDGPDGALNDGPGGAYYPQLAVFRGRVYNTWYELENGVTRIRVAVLEETDAGSLWRPVDGGTNGLNRDPSRDALWSRLVVHGDTLVAYWHERDGSDRRTIRVAAYGGDDLAPSWTYLDGDESAGLAAPGSLGSDYASLASYDGSLYAAWRSSNGSAYQIRVAVFTGDLADPEWRLVDGGSHGINRDIAADAYYPKLHVYAGRLYAAWYERNGTARQLRVAVFNGDDVNPAWSLVDRGGARGLNYDTGAGARGPQLLSHGGAMYAVWYEEDATSGGTVRVARYNGDDATPEWGLVDGGGPDGLDRGTGTRAWWARAVSHGSYLVVAWSENDAGPYRIRASAYDPGAGTWYRLDPPSGLNAGATHAAEYPHLVSDGERLFVSWSERYDRVFRVFVREGAM